MVSNLQFNWLDQNYMTGGWLLNFGLAHRPSSVSLIGSKEIYPMRPIPAYRAGIGLPENRRLSESNSKPPDHHSSPFTEWGFWAGLINLSEIESQYSNRKAY
jgi:hypothetical protein